MPPIETDKLHQKALWWEFAGYDDTGNPTVYDYVELNVRWENVNREMVDPQGNTIGVDAVVVVDRTVPAHSVMWLGSESELPDGQDYPDSDLRHVMIASDISDINNRHNRRLAYCMRLSDSMPTIVERS